MRETLLLLTQNLHEITRSRRERGMVSVKGKGQMKTWYVRGKDLNFSSRREFPYSNRVVRQTDGSNFAAQNNADEAFIRAVDESLDKHVISHAESSENASPGRRRSKHSSQFLGIPGVDIDGSKKDLFSTFRMEELRLRTWVFLSSCSVFLRLAPPCSALLCSFAG